MNKIVLENDTVIENNLDRAIELEVIEKNIFFTVNTLQITIHETTSLEIDYHVLKRSKLNIKITVLPNVSFTLVERRKGRKLKVQYQLELQEKSEITWDRCFKNESMRGLDIVQLNGVGATFRMTLSTVARGNEKYDMMFYHNASKTTCDFVNEGKTLKHGKIIFQTTNVVERGKKDCVISEKQSIITENERECKIVPNLLLEEESVEVHQEVWIKEREQ